MIEGVSTTGYGILGLLEIEPYSAYELTTQLKRGWRFIWPRAERGYYTEPKKLVALGLATARTERNGRRKRTVYSITPAGRRALREWLKEPSPIPEFEAEGLVRLGFAENATPQDVVRALESFREGANQISTMGLSVARGYLDGEGLYPQRLHLITLVARFFAEYVRFLDRFGSWATDEVSTWRSTKDPKEFEDILGELRRCVAVFERQLGKNARSVRT